MNNEWMELPESLDIYGTSVEEQEKLEEGMVFYLRTCGFRKEETNAYGLGFVRRHLYCGGMTELCINKKGGIG